MQSSQRNSRHAHINIHHGKTQVWNRGGIAPEGIEELTRLAKLVKPEAVVWRGDANLSHNQHGVRILGVPICSAAFVRRQLEEKSAEQETLFHRIPWMEDTQALAFAVDVRNNKDEFLAACSSPRAIRAFAESHDTNVWQSELQIVPRPSPNCHSLWVELTSALRSRVAAHWSSWADCIT